MYRRSLVTNPPKKHNDDEEFFEKMLNREASERVGEPNLTPLKMRCEMQHHQTDKLGGYEDYVRAKNEKYMRKARG